MSKLRVLAIVSLTTTGLVLGARQLGGLQPLELMAADQQLRLSGDRGLDDRLLVVAVTEADIRAQGAWPLSDAVIAQTLATLQQNHPRAIGLDIFRDIDHPPGTRSLTAQLQQPNVISVSYFGHTPDERIPAPPHVPEAQVGFSDLVTDPDGIVRRNLLFLADGSRELTSFSLQLASLYWSKVCPQTTPAQTGAASAKTRSDCQPIKDQLTPAGELQVGQTVFTRLQPTAGGYQAIDAQGYQILLTYRSELKSVRQVTLQQVLARQVDPTWIRGKIVLLGVTAPSGKDLLYTPYSAAARDSRLMPGVIIHAQMVSQVLSAVLDQQRLVWYWDDRLESGWIFVWSLVGSALALRIRHFGWLSLANITALGSLLGLYLAISAEAGWIPIAAPVLGLVLATGSVIAYRLHHDLFHDALTGLPNRSRFLKYLKRAMPKSSASLSTPLAVLFLDLDRFKVVNDNLGHHVGDELLRSSRDRLSACLRPGDTLARVGGDEFAILLANLTRPSEALQIADTLQCQMASPFRIGQQEIFTGVSIGIALATDRQLPEDLLRNAHTALYQAKAQGKDRSEVFAADMRVQVIRRSQLETDLRRAIEQQEFQLHYQPIVVLATQQTAGFEALARWQHPQHGMISPAEFIPVAEEIGLIVELGQWVLEAACRQLKQWQTQFPCDPPLMVSVNLSGQQFTQLDLVDSIEQTLKRVGLDGRSLKLEITESVAVQDVEAAIAMLAQLKALNLQLSIDDFGTGYSSLSYLHRFPVDTLKVDRTFVGRLDEPGNEGAIVKTVIGLAHSLNMNVVAEGVETAVQRAKLQSLGCEYGQGYFFSKPLPVEAAEALLASRTCGH